MKWNYGLRRTKGSLSFGYTGVSVLYCDSVDEVNKHHFVVENKIDFPSDALIQCGLYWMAIKETEKKEKVTFSFFGSSFVTGMIHLIFQGNESPFFKTWSFGFGKVPRRRTRRRLRTDGWERARWSWTLFTISSSVICLISLQNQLLSFDVAYCPEIICWALQWFSKVGRHNPSIDTQRRAKKINWMDFKCFDRTPKILEKQSIDKLVRFKIQLIRLAAIFFRNINF